MRGADLDFLDIDPSGLRAQFQGAPGDNQTHHVAAFLLEGFVYGRGAEAINAMRETWQAIYRQPIAYNPSDLALGTAAAIDGWELAAYADLLSGNFSLLGDWVQADVGS